ncbi:MAG: DUF4399 domain-containing protein [Gemmatimonadaceae bacterium]
MRYAVVHAVLLASLTACGPKEETLPILETAGGSAGVPARARITAPADGDTVGPNVTIALAADQVIVEPGTGVRVAGRGHHHLVVDVPPPEGDSVIGRGAGVVHLGDGSSVHTLTGLAPGVHRVIAILGYGDHVPIEHAGSDTVVFVVRAGEAP